MRKGIDLMLKKASAMGGSDGPDGPDENYEGLKVMEDIYGGGVDSKPIGEMTPQEIVEEYKNAPSGSVTRKFIIVYLEMSGMKDVCPEIFL